MRTIISYASLWEDTATNIMEREVVAKLSFEKIINSLTRVIGGMIRVKATRLPVTPSIFLNVSIYIFFLVATLALVPSIGWYTLLINVLIYLVICMCFDTWRYFERSIWPRYY